MGLFQDALAKEKRRGRGATCSIALVVLKMSEQERSEFKTALADPFVSAVMVCGALTAAYKIDIKPWIVQRHRRRECACERLSK